MTSVPQTEDPNEPITPEDIYLRAIPSVSGDVKLWRVTAQYNDVTCTDRTVEMDNPRARAEFIEAFADKLGVKLHDLIWMDAYLLTAVDAHLAEKETAEQTHGDSEPVPLKVQTIGELIGQYPQLRKPVIHGLVRQGETMNVIAPSKAGKSWLVADLALSIAADRKWLDLFDVEPGRVLIIDNELHKETITFRIQKVADAMGLVLSDYDQNLDVISLRGRLTDIYGLGLRLLDRLEPGVYRLIVLDAFYRAFPAGVSENDNSGMSQVYNCIDTYALQLDCGFTCIHHASKGNQSNKAITDVGSGAGSQSRATDTHLILRPHSEPRAVVLDAAVRSWPPIEPVALRWEWPLWTPDPELDPAALKSERAAQQAAGQQVAVAQKEKDILDTFVHFPDGATKTDIRGRVGKGKTFEAAWLSVCNSGKVTECTITKANHQKYDGFKRVYQDHETDELDT